MKRYDNIYEKICTEDNIRLAHYMAKKDKGSYQAVKYVDANLDKCVKEIQNMLINKTYVVGNYNIKVIQDKGKQRLLHKLPYFPDRIIQWAILLQTEEIFIRTFTNSTCASLKHRGIHYASNLLTSYMNNDFQGTQYCLKIDIKKYYPSINREILKKMLRRKFKDENLLWILDNIIDSMNNNDIQKLSLPQEYKDLYSRPNKGIPIGSYLSQYLANFYLSYFDHWLKEVMSCKYVVRYMDDVVILHGSKERLREVFDEMRNYLKENLDLDIKANYQIFPTLVRGVDFVGYRHFYGYKLLRRSTYKRCKKKMIELTTKGTYDNPITYHDWCSYVSYIGWLTWCNSYTFFMTYCLNSIPLINDYYRNNIKTAKKKNKRQVISLGIYLKKCKEHKVYYSPIDVKRKLLHSNSKEKGVDGFGNEQKSAINNG